MRTAGTKLLSLALAVLLALGTLPQAVFAVGATPPEGAGGKIIAFEALSDSVANKTVPHGTSLEVLELPNTLTATVETPAAAEPEDVVQDSGEPAQEADGGTPDGGTTGGDSVSGNDGSDPAVDGENEEVTGDNDRQAGSPSDAQQEGGEDEDGLLQMQGTTSSVFALGNGRGDGSPDIPAEDNTGSTQTVSVPVREWVPKPEYDRNTPDTYVFTPVLDEAYSLAAGVELPVITVTVARPATAAMEGNEMESDNNKTFATAMNSEASSANTIDLNDDDETLLAAAASSGEAWSYDNTTKTVTIYNGAITITGSVSNGKRVVVDGSADITLEDVSISEPGAGALSVLNNGAVTLTLCGSNTLKGSGNNASAGLYVAPQANLTIKGSGTLTATGATWWPGIGGNYRSDDDTSGPATIVIEGGIIHASGGMFGAGIGGSSGHMGAIVIIKGGAVSCTDNISSGIGGGGGGGPIIPGTTIISGGSVKASSIQDNPTDGNGNPVYRGMLSGQSGVTSVSVDEIPFWIDDNHNGDDALYLYMTGEDHIVDVEIGGTVTRYTATWNSDSSTFSWASHDAHGITLTADPAMGGSPTASLTSATDGTHITLAANPASGYTFIGWTVVSPSAITLSDVGSSTATFTMPNEAVEIRANYTVSTYSLTVTSGSGGSVTPSGTSSAMVGTPVTATASAHSGYTFERWEATGTSVSNTAAISFNMPDNDVTLNAVFRYVGGGSSSGDNDSDNSSAPTVTIPPTAQPDWPTIGSVSGKTAGTNTQRSFAITDSLVKTALEKAQAEAKAQNRTAYGIGVQLALDTPATAGLTATLERAALNRLVSAGAKQLEITGAPISLTLGAKALAELQKQSTGDVTITVKPVTVGSVRNAYDISFSYVKNGNAVNITSLGTGTATLSIPFIPAKGEATGGFYAVYVDGKGKVNRIADSSYDANTGSVMFCTDHFSVYGVGYTVPSAKFTDTAKHWAAESIDYVVGKGLLSGTSETTFAPDTAMTRAILVTALGRLSSVDTKTYTANSFTDVKSDSAFRPYIEWAYQKGIVQGIGGNQFAPDRAITREEIAVIFTNFAKATGYRLQVTRTATTYADSSGIGSAYKKAVTAMQQAGIMMGGSGNKFNPKANSTRAEVSSMLHRYIKLTIDPSTAQGWAKNDAGQYLYYKNGKAVTGTQTINGTKYFFETTGVLKTGWVKDGDNWRYYSDNKAAMGWLDIGDKCYYFTKDVLMVSGKWLEIDGKWYYFNADGSLARSTKIDNYEVDENGVRKTK